jgi:hypothetical protein
MDRRRGDSESRIAIHELGASGKASADMSLVAVRFLLLALAVELTSLPALTHQDWQPAT